MSSGSERTPNVWAGGGARPSEGSNDIKPGRPRSALNARRESPPPSIAALSCGLAYICTVLFKNNLKLTYEFSRKYTLIKLIIGRNTIIGINFH